MAPANQYKLAPGSSLSLLSNNDNKKKLIFILSTYYVPENISLNFHMVLYNYIQSSQYVCEVGVTTIKKKKKFQELEAKCQDT